MQTTSKLQPLSQYTKHDCMYWGEREDWLVAHAMTGEDDAHNLIQVSNFQVMRSELEQIPQEGELASPYVECFSHFACGWIDYLLVDPRNAAQVAVAEDMLRQIEDYPLLNEDHLSQLECDRHEEEEHEKYGPYSSECSICEGDVLEHEGHKRNGEAVEDCWLCRKETQQ